MTVLRFYPSYKTTGQPVTLSWILVEEHEVSGFETLENLSTSSSTECHPSFSHADFTSPEFYSGNIARVMSYLHMQWVVECKDACV